MQFPSIPCWDLLPVFVDGPLPILAECPPGSSSSFLAGVTCCWWWMVPRHSWLRALAAVPGNSSLGSAAGVRGLSLANPG